MVTIASLLVLLVVVIGANGANGDDASPLEFQFQNTVDWHHLGPSVDAGNNLTVAYNGTHTHVLDASTLPNGMEVKDAGYWAWRLVETKSGPSARQYHAMASLGDGRVLMYGGRNDNKYFNDAWIFALSSPSSNIGDDKNGAAAAAAAVGKWTPTKDGPSARYDHAMATLGDGRVLMYGGYGGNSLKDAWIFELSPFLNIDNEKNGAVTAAAAAAAAAVKTWTRTKDGPSARNDHTMATLGNGRVLMFGGRDDNKNLNDAWVFELALSLNIVGNWVPATIGPSARFHHAMASVENGRVLMYGGWDGISHLNDAWIFELSSTFLNIGNRNNGVTAEAAGAAGAAAAAAVGKWTKSKDGPSLRGTHSMASSGNGRVLMYGGWDGINHLNDAWMFELSSTFLNIANENNGVAAEALVGNWARTMDGPGVRGWHAMATLGNGRVLMYGGFLKTTTYKGYEEDLNDTWIFELSPFLNNNDGGKNGVAAAAAAAAAAPGGTWKPTTIGPGARNSHAMATLGNDRVLMFGGDNVNNNVLNDAWVFELSPYSLNNENGKNGKNGAAAAASAVGTWTQTQGGPSARAYHAMASLGGGRVLLYGGFGVNKDVLNDAWIFELSPSLNTDDQKNGAAAAAGAWTQTTTGPGGRGSHAMAALVNGRVLMFGGTHEYNKNVLKDAWIFELSPSLNIDDGKNGATTTAAAAAAVGNWELATIGPIGPSARIGHTMATLGNGRVLMYGGGDLLNLFNDAWIFGFRGVNQNQSLWTKLDLQSTSPRKNHVMASLTFDASTTTTDTLAPRVLLFGGHILPTIGLTTTGSFANDAWIMLAGCPAGMFGPYCDKCSEDQYKAGMTNGTTFCTPCPSGTTTAKKGSTAEDQCVLCKNHSIYSSCSVDLRQKPYKPEFRCFGTYGLECEIECPGGAKNPCSGNGDCDDGVNGNGRCTCDALYTLSLDCSFPVAGILVTFGILFFLGVIYFLRHRFTKKVKKQDHEYQLLDVQHEETKHTLQETKEDRNKLQEAWIVQRGDVKLMEVVGKGASGEVWRGRWRNLDVVCKKMFPQNMEKFGLNLMTGSSTTQSSSSSSSSKMNSVSQTMLENLEVGVMMRLRHPRIVAFLGAGELIEPPIEGLKVPRVGIFVMMEFAAGGDLIQRYQKAAGSTETFPWKERVQCAMDIADGMAFIHRKGFIHRDLKSLNVLCDEQGRCMIADLGLVAMNIQPPPNVEQGTALPSETKEVTSIQVELTSNTNNHTKMKGTIAWMAPEVMTNNYGFKADVFSFGMVMYELLTCRAPWSGTKKKFMLQIETAVNAGERPPMEEKDLVDTPVKFVELMKRCWQSDPKARPTFEEALVELHRMS